MDIKKSKVVSIILMNILYEEIAKIIGFEIDKGENGNYTTVDLLIELNEVLSLSCEMLDKDIAKNNFRT